MVKHTQTICRLLPTNCLSVFDHFVGLALKVLKSVQEMPHESDVFLAGIRMVAMPVMDACCKDQSL